MTFTGYYPGQDQKAAAREYLAERDREQAAETLRGADGRLNRSRRWLEKYMERRNANRKIENYFKVSTVATKTEEIVDGEFTEIETQAPSTRLHGEGVGDAAQERGEETARSEVHQDWIDRALAEEADPQRSYESRMGKAEGGKVGGGEDDRGTDGADPSYEPFSLDDPLPF